MATQDWHDHEPAELYRTIYLARAQPGTILWESTIARRGWLARPLLDAANYGEIGPGWALLALRLDRRLRREGAPPDTRPRLLAIGAGEMCFTLPVRAPHWVRQAALAMSRVALGCCEICLRGPTARLSIDGVRVPETLRLCRWHYDRLAATRLPSSCRVEAWDILQHGAGALRAMLLGGRLSPTGVEAALRQFVESTPTGPGEIGWIPDELMAHALAHLSPATLAGVSAEALLPLLADRDEDVRQAAVLAMACARGGTAAVASGDGLPDDGGVQVLATGAQITVSGPPVTDDAAQPDVVDHQRADEFDERPYALPRPTYPLETWLVDTASGSQYVIVRDAERVWWLGGRNEGSARSVPLPRGCLYQIQYPTPWPPVLGETLLLLPPQHLDSWDPARVPGGGKHTSEVVACTPLLSEPEPEPPSRAGGDSALCAAEAPATEALAKDVRGAAECAEEGA